MVVNMAGIRGKECVSTRGDLTGGERVDTFERDRSNNEL